MSEPTPEQLKQLQEVNLTFLEKEFDNIRVAGVPVVRAINYKTIQILNNISLKTLLAEPEKVAEGGGDNA